MFVISATCTCTWSRVLLERTGLTILPVSRSYKWEVSLSVCNIKIQNMDRSLSQHIVYCPADSLHSVNTFISFFGRQITMVCRPGPSAARSSHDSCTLYRCTHKIRRCHVRNTSVKLTVLINMVEKREGRHHVEDLGVDGRIILKRMLRKSCGNA